MYFCTLFYGPKNISRKVYTIIKKCIRGTEYLKNLDAQLKMVLPFPGRTPTFFFFLTPEA